MEERLMLWEAYAKNGKKLYDSSQEGQVVNTAFNNFDDTVKLQAIQAIELSIQQNEETCSMITGVFREKLGGIEQKDAVTNVQVGVRQSSYITKQYYQKMDLLTRDILIDILDLSKSVYKNGLSGTIILGENLVKNFTALPKHYTVSSYDISIADSAETIKEQETIKQITVDLTKGGLIDADVILDMITAKSLTKMKADVKASLLKKKSENDQLDKLSQEVQQLNKQLTDTSSQNQQLQKQIQKLNEDKLNLEKDRLDFEKQLKWFIAKDDSQYNQEKLELEKKGVTLEGAQLLDDNHRNDEVKNNWKE